MADNQNETEVKAQTVNSKDDAHEQDGVNKSDTSHKCESGEAEAECKSTIADLPWTIDQEDLLGVEAYRAAIIDYINRADTPFSLALVGEWGCGKTSIMNGIYESLCKYNQPRYYGIRINTWQFSILTQPQHAIISMLKAMVDQIAYLKPSEITKERRDNIDKLLKCLLIAGVKIAYKVIDAKYTGGMLSQVGLDANTVVDTVVDEMSNSDKADKAKNDDNNDIQEPADSIVKKLKNEINCLVHDVLIINNKCTACNDYTCEYKEQSGKLPYNGMKQGFIFFIDDLDRIDPALSIEILETLKNIFDIKQCIFIVAVDHNRLGKGLESKFGPRNIQNDYEYACYLDKIFQIMIQIRTGFYDTEQLVKKMLLKVSWFEDGELSQDELKELELLLRQSIGDNPRRIKNFFNKLSFGCVLSIHTDRYARENNLAQQAQMSLLNKLEVKDRKKIHFIYISLLTAYPEIHNLIAIKPYFKGWNLDLVHQVFMPYFNNNIGEIDAALNKAKLSMISLNCENKPKEEWEVALFQICFMVDRLRCNFIQILNHFRKIDKILSAVSNGNYEDMILEMFDIFDINAGTSKSMISIMKSHGL